MIGLTAIFFLISIAEGRYFVYECAYMKNLKIFFDS